jgi:hypothetical protein
MGSLKYFISVDTEADNAWSSPETIEMNNFKEIPRFQELCEKYNIIPTYLLTYEYATYEPAIEYLKPKLQQGRCEIGHHLHVWTTPPFQDEKEGVDLDWLQAYQYELPDELFEKKANSLHEAIIDAFGKPPVIHRAGRWGIDKRSIDWLSRNDYLIDSSVIPFYNMSSNPGKSMPGRDFSKYANNPFFWETKNTNAILEIPVSVNCKRKNLKLITKLIQDIFPNNMQIRKVINKIHRPKMLRPNPTYLSADYRRMIKNSGENGGTLNMMLHSSELAYQCSPFTQTKENYQRVWQILENVFAEINNQGYQSISLHDYYHNLKETAIRSTVEC